MAKVLPIIRGDYTAIDTYQYQDGMHRTRTFIVFYMIYRYIFLCVVQMFLVLTHIDTLAIPGRYDYDAHAFISYIYLCPVHPVVPPSTHPQCNPSLHQPTKPKQPRPSPAPRACWR